MLERMGIILTFIIIFIAALAIEEIIFNELRMDSKQRRKIRSITATVFIFIAVVLRIILTLEIPTVFENHFINNPIQNRP